MTDRSSRSPGASMTDYLVVYSTWLFDQYQWPVRAGLLFSHVKSRRWFCVLPYLYVQGLPWPISCVVNRSNLEYMCLIIATKYGSALIAFVTSSGSHPLPVLHKPYGGGYLAFRNGHRRAFLTPALERTPTVTHTHTGPRVVNRSGWARLCINVRTILSDPDPTGSDIETIFGLQVSIRLARYPDGYSCGYQNCRQYWFERKNFLGEFLTTAGRSGENS